MNVSLRKLIFLYLALLVPWMVNAQLERYDVIPNESFQYQFQSQFNFNEVRSDELGFIPNSQVGGNKYQFTYTPKEGFFGVDVVHISYWSGPGFQKFYKDIEIEVKKSRVIAKSDYVAGVPYGSEGIEIDVLANDSGNRGILNLTNIVVSNNGQAFIDGDIVFFIPDEDFSGVATFNYIVCDDLGTCATGVVTVLVEDNFVENQDQQLQVITSRNIPISIPLSFALDYVDVDPSNGSINDLGNNILEYTPNANYFGEDMFKVAGYTSNGVLITLTVDVDVLFKDEPNKIAFDDYAFTAENTPVEIDVLQNDIGSYIINSFAQSSDGDVQRVGSSGRFNFTPNENFTGRASFTYGVRSPTGFGELERATVYITVKDQVPSSYNRLSTPKNYPKVINYIAPISGYDFNIIKAPKNGNVFVYAGYQEHQSIHGMTVEGEDYILYEPFKDFYGEDEFELEYCINGSCHLIKILMDVRDYVVPGTKSCIDFDCIWPGDANNDGTVNMGDLLQLGQNVGIRGKVREDQSVEWYGHYGEDWNNPYARSTVDLKYTDADGDGLIASLDTTSISRCYGLQHNLTPPAESFLLTLPFYLQPTSSEPASPGDVLEFNILIGTKQNPAFDIYGFQFDFKTEPQFVRPGSMEVEFNKTAWTTGGSPVLHMSKKIGDNKIEAGYTRTNGKSKDGYGPIGKLRFVIDDDVQGFRLGDKPEIIVRVESAGGIFGSGEAFSLGGSIVSIPLNLDVKEEEIVEPNELKVFPNPAKDIMTVHLNGQHDIEQVIVYNITGQEVFNSGNINSVKQIIDVTQFNAGAYIVKAVTTGGVITKKFEVVEE